MPSAMIHLKSGLYFDPDPGDGFLVGLFAPDCIKEREQKDLLHFRTSANRDADLRALLHRYGTHDKYLLGAVFHLYTYYLWDEGPQADHRAAYIGETWFRDYRMEINLASCYMYHHDPELRRTFERIMNCPASEYASAAEYPPDRVRGFLEHSYEYITTHDVGPSEFFTPDVTGRFCRTAARKFDEWLKEEV